eukprot:TRINITY_DN11841_c0_g1_i1.p1 TRINITY_DN11841_c0_g1~~TRINITY_DN11841_c0_g1_i1.p1  ORF type:complete len:498 (-),score=101.52 TRINITY_DN11841_c0_g1_i1:29-1522(-)
MQTFDTPIFRNCSFVLDLGSLSFRRKALIQKYITDNGGKLQGLFNPLPTCLVCSNDQIRNKSRKHNLARDSGVPVVTDSYVEDAVNTRKRLDRITLILDGMVESLPTPMLNHLSVLENKVMQGFQSGFQDMFSVVATRLSDVQNCAIVDGNAHLPTCVNRYFMNLTTKKVQGKPVVTSGDISLQDVHSIQLAKRKLLLKQKTKKQQLELERIYFEQQKKWKQENELKQKLQEERDLQKWKLEKQKQLEQDRKEKAQTREFLKANQVLLNLKHRSDNPEDYAPVSQKWLVLGKSSLSRSERVSLANEALDVFGLQLLTNDESELKKPKKPAQFSYLNACRKSIGLPPIRSGTDKKKVVSHAGRKIFVGKIRIDDILETGDKQIWDEDTINQYINHRVQELQDVFRVYGEVEEFSEDWGNRGFGFVVYQYAKDAKLAVNRLKDFKDRRVISREIKANLRDQGLDILMAPLPNYYVRWPKYYQRMLQNKRKRRLAKMMKK